MRRLRVLTWHVHGNYLLYLSRCGVDFFLPTRPDGSNGYGGRGKTFPFAVNVHDVPADAVANHEFDCVLYQCRRNYEVDQFEILSPSQRRLPRIYLEHDTPPGDPTTARHWFDDPAGLLVHVTPFNAMMWNCGGTPTRVIDHGVFVPQSVQYNGEVKKGLTVVNHLRQRGRRLGADIFEELRCEVPLELVGMDAESLGGLGEVFPPELPAFMARYRFFFHPIRFTSLGLALLEAMMVGLPVVGIAATELVTVVRNGESGFIDTDPAKLVEPMRMLLRDSAEARRMGENARRAACERFNIHRFTRDWERTFAEVAGRPCRETTAVTSGFEEAPCGGSR